MRYHLYRIRDNLLTHLYDHPDPLSVTEWAQADYGCYANGHQANDRYVIINSQNGKVARTFGLKIHIQTTMVDVSALS